MCGVFGFCTKNGSGPDPKRLQRIAAATEARGPHAFGFAWIDGRGRLKMFKQKGRITDAMGVLSLARDARMLIGHCRWATDGDPRDNINNHPHPADGGWYVHNGVIANWRGLVDQFDMRLVSRCDSEVIGQLVERDDGPMLDRLIAACDSTCAQSLVVLGLWKSPERLVALRRGNPLHLGETRDGWYFGSLAAELPRGAFSLRDDSALEFTTSDAGAVEMTAYDAAVAEGAE